MLPPAYVRRDAVAAVTAIDRGWLLLLVLEGGQAFLARAREALTRGDMAAFAQDLGRTQDVLLTLSKHIDGTAGRDVAAGLGRLHALLVGRLALANAERGLALVDEVQGAYGPLVEAYREIVTRIAASA